MRNLWIKFTKQLFKESKNKIVLTSTPSALSGLNSNRKLPFDGFQIYENTDCEIYLHCNAK